MARWNQTWKCNACGHELHKTISYPKYGASERPLKDIAKHAVCSKCGARDCTITEEPPNGRKYTL